MTLNLPDCEVMDGKAGGDNSGGPVEFRNRPRRAGILANDQILDSDQYTGCAKLDRSRFHFEAAVGASEQRVQLAHAVGTSGIEGLARHQRRDADFPRPQSRRAGHFVERFVSRGKIRATGGGDGYQQRSKNSHKDSPK